ncbi:hypothetical protein IE53DRAFT_383963 [Violaceomyces palustris]|uniref:Uncharacterized protein n=1 Tax=Violaceomyces palustris TaxID=1673888 RepID=A0ACD0P6A6_9BASI|nr:hypothetical protein IE53DRAFT_383963 [Violaceomyces palustris]
MNHLNLPEEIVLNILSNLDPRSLATVSITSKTLHRLSTSPCLWEEPYLLRWSTGDPERERRRGTLPHRLLHHRNLLNRMVKSSSNGRLEPLHSSEYLDSLLSGDQLSSSNRAAIKTREPPDFYRVFLERISIDQEVLDVVYQQVESTHARIPACAFVSKRFGRDAFDILMALVRSQSTGPSGSNHGRPCGGCRRRRRRRRRRRSGRSNGDGVDEIVSEEEEDDDDEGYKLSAYEVHLPGTKRSDSHHMVILHHAREMLEHIQRKQAMSGLDSFRPLHLPLSQHVLEPPNRKTRFETERVISLLSMFRGGDEQEIRQTLDLLSLACDLHLQTKGILTPISNRKTKEGRDRILTGAELVCDQEEGRGKGKREEMRWEDCVEVVKGISSFMRENGFRPASSTKYHDLDNHFLNFCLETNRETLPLSLTVLFCALANRLGLVASLCNFPTRIIALVQVGGEDEDDDEDEEDQRQSPTTGFWVDVNGRVAGDPDGGSEGDAEQGEDQHACILGEEDLRRRAARLGLGLTQEMKRGAPPCLIALRAARNIVASVQRAQVFHRGDESEEILSRQAMERDMERSERLAAFGSRAEGDSEGSVDHERTKRPDTRLVVMAEQMGLLPIATDNVPFGVEEGPFVSQEDLEEEEEDLLKWSRLRHLRKVSGVRCGILQGARAKNWSEHDQQASMYAASNAFVRLSSELGDRGADWVVGLVQSYFNLDAEVISRDFLGIESELAGDKDGEKDEVEDPSSSQPSRNGGGEDEEGRGRRKGIFIENRRIRSVLSELLGSVKQRDMEPPKVNRRTEEGSVDRPSSSNRSDDEAEEEEGDGIGEGGAQQDVWDERKGKPGNGQVQYRIGMVFKHRRYDYVACCIGWDPYCSAPEEWIVSMGVDRLPPPKDRLEEGHGGGAGDGGRRRTRFRGRWQPFYHSQVSDGTKRYVAECNFESVQGPIWLDGTEDGRRTGGEGGGGGGGVGRFEKRMDSKVREGVRRLIGMRGMGETFRCFDQAKGRFLLCRQGQASFPED